MMDLLAREIGRLRPSKEEIASVSKSVKTFTTLLSKSLGKKAEVFVGGSFAKGTLVKGKEYDIDIFVRFDEKYKDISEILDKALKIISKRGYKVERVHGSRDYFRVHGEMKGVYFELVPVTKINNPKKEKNVTDLSTFHVKYVKKKAKGLEDHIRLAKAFCYSVGVYGAESYIKGFSGYALECLIIHYKSFTKMIKALSNVKDKLIIDIEKKYKNAHEIKIFMNENRQQSPIILVDPIYKERNVLAALSHETFAKFQQAAKEFLNNPSEEFFRERKTDYKEMETKAGRNKGEFIALRIETDRQKGDIAGTKMKKFFEHIIWLISKEYDIIETSFVYSKENYANACVAAKSKGKLVRKGPPSSMIEASREFRKNHPLAYEKKGCWYVDVAVSPSLREAIGNIASDKKHLREMGITRVSVL